MAFFNDLGKKIGNVAGAAADKTKEMAKVAKLNNDISKCEKQIRNLYEEIGKMVFEKEKFNENSEVYSKCVAIISEQQKIIELEKKIEEVKADDDALEVVVVEEEPGAVCPGCGKIVMEGKFCPECGSTVVQEGEFTEE